MQGRRGFTLVELLVVVAIMSAMIAMLLPSLRDAQEQARTVVCAANQRSLIMASIMYATDNAERLPPFAQADYAANHAPYWDLYLCLYLKFANKSTKPNTYIYTTSVFACPSICEGWRHTPDGTRTYRMSASVGGWANGQGVVPEMPMTSFRRVSDLVVFCESRSPEAINYASASYLRTWIDRQAAHKLDGPINMTPPLALTGGGNFAIADGHVTYINYGDATTTPKPYLPVGGLHLDPTGTQSF